MRFLALLAAIVVVGLVIRIVFLRAYVSTNLSFDDGLWYHTQANLLVDGHGLIDPLAYVFQGRVRESAGHRARCGVVFRWDVGLRASARPGGGRDPRRRSDRLPRP